MGRFVFREVLLREVKYVESKTNSMKKNIHPKYVETQVTCGCGNKFTTRATKPELKVDICNVCHPFYTGKQKLVDREGRVDKFKKKFADASYSNKKK